MNVGIAITAIFALLLGGGAGYYYGYDVGYEKAAGVKSEVNKQKIRACPEYWYKDEMPYVGETEPPNREYFIIDGKRVELSEVDVEWVKSNCSVKEPKIVQ